MSIKHGTHVSVIIGLLCEHGSLTSAEMVEKGTIRSHGYARCLLRTLLDVGSVERFRLPKQPSFHASQYFYRLTREELEMRA